MVQRRRVCARRARRGTWPAGPDFVGELLGNGALFHGAGWREPGRRGKRGVPRAPWRRNGSSRLFRFRFRIAAAKLARKMEARGGRFDERNRARRDRTGTALDATGGWRPGEKLLRVECGAAESFSIAA